MPPRFPVKFSIVTPSFNQPDWLRACLASVADQAGSDIEVEHRVQDGSPPEQRPAIGRVCQRFPRAILDQETDAGMYDALNRGFDRATGDVFGYLNCDEQYLAGTLEMVARHFAHHPESDVVYGDALVVDAEGQYRCHRQSLPPRLRHTVACHLAVLTCALFFRRRLWEEGMRFDAQFKAIGDVDLVVRWVRQGVRMHHLPQVLSVFADTGDNLGASKRVREEMRRLQARFPAWWRHTALLWATIHRWRRWRAGYYRPQPLTYAIYTRQSPETRRSFEVRRPTAVWRSRLKVAG